MGTVEITTKVAGSSAADVFGRLIDFRAYPTFSPAVLAVDATDVSDSKIISSWEVKFRRGILRWTEAAMHDRSTGLITFKQIEGDIDEFTGSWRVNDDVDAAVEVDFQVTFDIGIPTLSSIIDPIAEDALHENITALLHGMFPERAVVSSARTGDGRTWAT